MIDYLCVLFVGNYFKFHPQTIIQQHGGLERNAGQSSGRSQYESLYNKWLTYY
jgi:hypothetical protein